MAIVWHLYYIEVHLQSLLTWILLHRNCDHKVSERTFNLTELSGNDSQQTYTPTYQPTNPNPNPHHNTTS